MSVTNYTIVEDITADGLAAKVAGLLGSKQPLGGVAFNPARQTFAQVMIEGTPDSGGGSGGSYVATGAAGARPADLTVAPTDADFNALVAQLNTAGLFMA